MQNYIFLGMNRVRDSDRKSKLTTMRPKRTKSETTHLRTPSRNPKNSITTSNKDPKGIWAASIQKLHISSTNIKHSFHK